MIFSFKQWVSDWVTVLFAPSYRIEAGLGTWSVVDSDGKLVEGGFVSEPAAKARAKELESRK